MPGTKLGKIGFWLGVTALIAVLVSMGFAAAASAGLLPDAPGYTVLGVLGPIFMLSSALTLILGLIAVFRDKDRAMLLIVVISLIAAMVLFIVGGEFIFAALGQGD